MIAVYVIGLALTFYVAWCLGANDAANPTDCAVGSGVITLRRAVLLFAIFVTIGAVLQGFMVMKTIDRGIVPRIEVLGAFTTILAVCIWITLCTWKGMPISTTQSIIGGVIGYGILTYGVHGLEWGVLSIVLISMAVTPILSMALAFGLYPVFKTFFVKISGRLSVSSVERLIKYMLIATLCFSAYAFGANDIANSTGVFVTVTKEMGSFPDYSAMILLAALGSVGIAFGAFTWGHKVIITGAKRVTRLTPLMGLSAEFSNAVVVFMFTTIPFILVGWGIPISTTHSSIGAIIGVGLIRGMGGIDRAIVTKISAAWILTIPIVALMSAALYGLVSIFI
jgi:PiT family inorganic phosphate transporter